MTVWNIENWRTSQIKCLFLYVYVIQLAFVSNVYCIKCFWILSAWIYKKTTTMNLSYIFKVHLMVVLWISLGLTFILSLTDSGLHGPVTTRYSGAGVCVYIIIYIYIYILRSRLVLRFAVADVFSALVLSFSRVKKFHVIIRVLTKWRFCKRSQISLKQWRNPIKTWTTE